MNTATLQIAVEVDDRGTVKIRQLGKAAREAGTEAETGFRRAGRSLGDMNSQVKTSLGSIKALYGAVAGAAVTAAIVQVSRASIQAASDLQQVSSKFDVVFQGQEQQAGQWSQTLVNSYAMSTRESKLYLSSVQDLLVPMGMASTAAGKMSFEVVKLSADLGSLNDLPTGAVMDDIQSALVGNYETMKKYGVVLNAAAVEQEALTTGLAKTKEEITAADKAQAAYQLIVKSSTAAIGDLGRTSGDLANQEKKRIALTEDLMAVYGNAMLPAYNRIITATNELIVNNKDLIEQDIRSWGEAAAAGINMFAGAISGTHKAYEGFIGLLERAQDYLISKGLGYEPVVSATKELANLNAQISELETELQSMGDTEGIWDVIVGNDTKAFELEERLESLKKMRDRLIAQESEKEAFKAELERVRVEGEKLQSALDHNTAAYHEAGEAADDAADRACEANKKRLSCTERTTKAINDALEAMFEKEEKDAKEAAERSAETLRKKYAEAAKGMTDTWLVQARDREDVEIRAINAIVDINSQGAEEATDHWRDFSEKTKDVVHDLVERGFKGEFESVADAAESLADTVVQIFIDMAAKIISNWVASGITTLFAGGGFSGFGLGNLLGGFTGGGGAGSAISLAGAANTVSGWLGGPTAGGAVSSVASSLGIGGGATAAGSAAGGAAIWGAAQGSYSGAIPAAAPTFITPIETAAPATAGLSAAATTLGLMAGPVLLAGLWDAFGSADPLKTQVINSPTGRGGGKYVDWEGTSPLEDVRLTIINDSRDLFNTIERFASAGADSVGGKLDPGEFASRITRISELITEDITTLSEVFGDTTAIMIESMDGTVASADNFVDSVSGFNVPMDRSSRMLEYAARAANGSYSAFQSLRGEFLDLGLSSNDAEMAMASMISKIVQLSEQDINIEANVDLNILENGQRAGGYSVSLDSDLGYTRDDQNNRGWVPNTGNSQYNYDYSDPWGNEYGKAARGTKSTQPVMVENYITLEIDGQKIDARIVKSAQKVYVANDRRKSNYGGMSK